MGKSKDNDSSKHIDTVFDLATAKEIEEARDDGRYATTSAWMRDAIAFVLKLRKKTNSDDFIKILDKEGKETWYVPVEMCNFLAYNPSRE